MSLYDDVYGITYTNAQAKVNVLDNDISNHFGIGFESLVELKKWAHDHLLDKIVYMSMQHKFYCISHKGELILPAVYRSYYDSILFYSKREGNKISDIHWVPEGYEYYSKAYLAGEQSDGIHKPLYYRDYTVPTGTYSEKHDAFNIAKPFPCFAKATGRDTSHIYTYIEHIAGECAPWLLAWLRAKMCHPTTKTQVVPIIVSRAQGSGKTTFAEVICKGLFGKDNVLVSDQYDSSARFNADSADALIVCLEEKEETDKRNTTGALKSRATATTIRKEQKGVDPIYQESYTDFIMTTNKDVPIKFEGREDQRRFMIMEADEKFTRKESDLADEVFTKLYGYDSNYNKVGTPFTEDIELIQQFKHELFSNQKIAEVPLRQFPKTNAYTRCFTLPRTGDAVDIETIMRSLAPFIKQALIDATVQENVDDVPLTDVIEYTSAIQYIPGFKGVPAMVALCLPLIFYEPQSRKIYPHSTVERTIYDCVPWLERDYGVTVYPNMEPLPCGFANVVGRYSRAPAARFVFIEDKHAAYNGSEYVGKLKEIQEEVIPLAPADTKRSGKRFRVNKYFKPDENGCFETVNELPLGAISLSNKTDDVMYLDTFLLESDACSYLQETLEKKVADEYKESGATEIDASILYKERLDTALRESMKLFEEGKVCRIVYSGAKSYHLLVRIKDVPESIEEYKWVHSYLCDKLSDKLEFDNSTSDPARLTRSPIKLERISEAYGLKVHGEQNLVCENWSHVYDINWRTLYLNWTRRPLRAIEQVHGKRLLPTKPEYRKAAEAIVDGTFWTDTEWDGQRQKCFFAAYRVLRMLGYSHTDLWEDGIMTKGVESYKHANEISYWKTRGTSNIIKQIDEQIDAYENQEDEDDDGTYSDEY